MNKLEMKKAYNIAIENGITKEQIRYDEKGITILKNAFKNERWDDETLPKHIKDLFPYVLQVGDHAFYDSIFTKLLMNNVEVIGDGGFANLKIKYLSLPNVHTIGVSAFYFSKIIEIVAPSLEYIKDYAFNKSNIKVLDLKNVKYIMNWAFEHSNIEKFIVPNLQGIEQYSFNKTSLNNLYKVWKN